MNLVVCPHCKSHRIVTAKVPKDVVVVMPCPSCGELVVLFRKKVIALSRKILEEGTLEERKDHLASVIAEFLEPGMFSVSDLSSDEEESELHDGGEVDAEAGGDEEADWLPPISEKEVDNFSRIQLQRLDDSEYFRRHFG